MRSVRELRARLFSELTKAAPKDNVNWADKVLELLNEFVEAKIKEQTGSHRG